MADFNELWPGGPVFAQAEHFKLTTDSVLLAAFVRTAGAKQGIDLGCASGALALLLLEREPGLEMTGLELMPEAAALAEENLRANAMDGRGRIICGDIRRHRELLRAGSFDLVAANPPYFPVGSGAAAADPRRGAARDESSCTLQELCAASAFLCRTGGGVFFVHRPERLSELFCAMTAAGIEPKRLRLVCSRSGDAPSLVLVEGRRGGRPGLKLEPALILKDPAGQETDEVKRIYHR